MTENPIPEETAPAPRKRLIVYVDGFNLYNGLHDETGTRHLWLDLVKLSGNLRPKSDLVKVKYFTSPIAGNELDARRRQQHYQHALLAHYPKLIQIVEGRHEPREVECKKCNKSWTTYDEKETDVNIAVNLVADAMSDAADDLLVVSGDTDLLPAMRMVQQVRPEMFVAAAFPPQRSIESIQLEMPASFTIGINKIRKSQLEERWIEPATGRIYQRPPKWRRDPPAQRPR